MFLRLLGGLEAISDTPFFRKCCVLRFLIRPAACFYTGYVEEGAVSISPSLRINIVFIDMHTNAQALRASLAPTLLLFQPEVSETKHEYRSSLDILY